MSINTHISTPKQLRYGVAAFFFVSGFGFASWASRIPTLQQKLHLNDAQLGTALFAAPLGLIVTLPITGILLQKYSSRYIMLIGSILYNILLFSLGFVTNNWQFMGVLFLFGISRNMMNIPVNTQAVGVQKLFPKSIISTFHGIWSVSGFAAAAVGGWMISKDITPVWHFFMVGALCFIIMSIAYKHTVRYDAKKTEDISAKASWFNLPDRALLKIGLIAFACMACEGIMYDWSGIYFQKIVNAPKALIAAGYIAFMSASSTGRFLGDWMINKIGTKKVLQGCSCFIALGLLLSISLPYVIPAILGFILVGLGVSCIIPLTMALAGRSSTRAPGVAIASVSTVSYLGFLLGPPAIGYVAEVANLRWSFAMGVLMSLGMLALVTKMKIKS
ncbi:MFS transporter [Parasediminibacterium paludis]|uniref:MFS transporter n=1 Tax=Parasediminibacterium paludis TaxID=908966 RepID=A0ABV8PSY7_9BACT